MIELFFETPLPVGYANQLSTAGVPAVLRIGRHVEVVVSHLLDGERTAKITGAGRDAFLKHPIGTVGGAYAAISHVLLDLTKITAAEYSVQRLDHFTLSDGWLALIRHGSIVDAAVQPEPDWL